MRIVLIGSGNVGTALGRKLSGAGHIISQVFSRNIHHARHLADELGTSAVSKLSHLSADADFYILAISDDELGRLEEWEFQTSQIVVHTAGSVSIDVLKKIGNNYGVLYPLQTLRREIDIVNEIPFLIDGSSEAVTRRIAALASSVSTIVRCVGDEERRKLHLAAVMANNFSNYLLTLTESFCKNERVDFHLLYPLVLEGIMRVKDHSPADLQTGPAMRNDRQTIAAHRSMLQNYPDLLNWYDLFTESISRQRP